MTQQSLQWNLKVFISLCRLQNSYTASQRANQDLEEKLHALVSSPPVVCHHCFGLTHFGLFQTLVLLTLERGDHKFAGLLLYSHLEPIRTSIFPHLPRCAQTVKPNRRNLIVRVWLLLWRSAPSQRPTVVLQPKRSRQQCGCVATRGQHAENLVERLNLRVESSVSISLSCCTVGIKFGIIFFLLLGLLAGIVLHMFVILGNLHLSILWIPQTQLFSLSITYLLFPVSLNVLNFRPRCCTLT